MGPPYFPISGIELCKSMEIWRTQKWVHLLQTWSLLQRHRVPVLLNFMKPFTHATECTSPHSYRIIYQKEEWYGDKGKDRSSRSIETSDRSVGHVRGREWRGSSEHISFGTLDPTASAKYSSPEDFKTARCWWFDDLSHWVNFDNLIDEMMVNYTYA